MIRLARNGPPGIKLSLPASANDRCIINMSQQQYADLHTQVGLQTRKLEDARRGVDQATDRRSERRYSDDADKRHQSKNHRVLSKSLALVSGTRP